MRRRFFIYSLFLCIIAAFAACDGLEISRNGKLDGMWHLVEVDTLIYGATPKAADYTNEGIYWSVQDKLLQVEDKRDRFLPCLLRFSFEKDVLNLKDAHIFHNRKEADEKIEDVSLLSPFGINSLEENFQVATLNRKSLVLFGQSLRLIFKRY